MGGRVERCATGVFPPDFQGQYSTARGRCLSAMVSQRTLRRTSSRVIVRPFVMLAAKCLGPGPRRLQMVKLAHELGDGDNYFEVFYPRRRAEAPPAHNRPRAA